MYHVAHVLTRKYTFSPAWPYSTRQVKEALRVLFKFDEKQAEEH